MPPIRVGVIRCDLHALYYAALMDQHDPDLLWRPELGLGGHFYFYTCYADPRKITVPTVSGFRIAKVWDENRQLAENMSTIFYGRPQVCDTFEEVSDDVDMVYVADCNGDGSDHLKLATPGIRKRVPTFVDKPFACEAKDALAIVDMAKKRRTPVLSLSILRTVPQLTQFARRFDEVGGAQFGVIKGGGPTLAGQIHAISMAQHVFGNGVESVECMGQQPLAYIHLNYGERKDRPSAGVVLNCWSGPTPHCAFFVSAYGPGGVIHSPPVGDFEFPWGAAKNLEITKEMMRTRKPPVPYDDMIENVAVATAARKAQKLGRTVKLSEVLKR